MFQQLSDISHEHWIFFVRMMIPQYNILNEPNDISYKHWFFMYLEKYCFHVCVLGTVPLCVVSSVLYLTVYNRSTWTTAWTCLQRSDSFRHGDPSFVPLKYVVIVRVTICTNVSHKLGSTKSVLILKQHQLYLSQKVKYIAKFKVRY